MPPTVNNPAALLPSTTAALDPLFRAIFDGVGSHHSHHAFDSVADGLATYGRATHTKWDFDAKAAKQPGSRPISKAERLDKRQDGSWVRDFVPAIRSDYPAALITGDRVAGSLCSRAAKRFRVEVINKQTGDREEIVCRLVTNTVSALVYGVIVEFSMSNRAHGTFLDGRDGKRKPLSFAKSELIRMLGHTEGMTRYVELCQFVTPKSATLSPSNPSKVRQDDTVAGQPDAGLQVQASVRVNPDGSATGLDHAV